VQPPADFARTLQDYIDRVKDATNEATKADRFRDFIRRVFPKADVGSLQGFYPDIDKFVKFVKAGFLVRGRPDSLFGNLVIEFEPELDDAHMKESYEQLQRYTAAIWAIHADRGQKHERLTCIATDGIEFFVYKPRRLVSIRTGIAPEQIALDEVDRADLRELEPDYAYQWLHRYIILAASELRPVDPEEFAKTFGVGSRVFNESYKLLEKSWSKAEKECAALYEQWAAHLRIAYGSQVDSEPLYLKHTYLATLAKLIVYASYSGGALPGSDDELTRIIDGTIFKQWRVGNFIEEDFFSWLPRVKDGIELAKTLASRLTPFDLTTVTSDVFKGLYQELVDPEARHDLGEYYTPDWLAQMIVKEVLKEDPKASVLDPACGSGTFLAAAISEKRQSLGELNPRELLQSIVSTVVGIDVHPLAVIVSRATYITLLGRDLLEARIGDIAIPVYLADSINLPIEKITLHGNIRVYTIDADGKQIFLPKEVAENPQLTDAAVDTVREYSKQIAEGEKRSADEFRLLIESKDQSFSSLSKDVTNALYDSAIAMAQLIKNKRDTIWGFIMKNYYKPIFLSQRKFDCLVGNPPWLSYRYVKSTEYQQFLKDLVMKDYALLSSKEVELITQMELATLFFVRCSDLYLRDGGTIGFVMPRSVFVSDQHNVFRSGSYKKVQLKMKRLIDMEDVSPLFNVPASTLIGKKNGKMEYPAPATVVSGTLPKKNAQLADALSNLSIRHTSMMLSRVGERSFLHEEGTIEPLAKGRSRYYELFRAGACTYPRPLWLVEVALHRKLGVDRRKPFVKTSSRASELAKGGYQDVNLKGEIEARFLWATLSGSELVPFGALTPLINVLPVEARKNEYHIVTREEAKTRGFTGLARWLEQVEKIWKEKRGEKSERMTVFQWLDYQRKLTSQSPSKHFKVLYNVSGTYLVSHVVRNEPVDVGVWDTRFKVNGIIADWKTVWYETDDEDEAYYLCAVFNSPMIDKQLKPMQSRGAYGERDIVKKPLEFPIPMFDPKNGVHQQLTQLGKSCEKRVKKVLPGLAEKYDSIGTIRREIKNLLEDELEQIDKLVRKIMKARSSSKSASDLRHWTKGQHNRAPLRYALESVSPANTPTRA